MKKFISTFVSAVIGLCAAIGAACCLAGCSDKTVVISTAEELYAMESGNNYVLAADIDLLGREWSTISVSTFDGGGHTIKNAIMYGGSGFFSVGKLSNVTLENISYTGECNYFGFAAGKGSVTNVEVKNCRATITTKASDTHLASYNYIGAVVGQRGTVENCRVSGCTLNINASGVTNIGGIAGESTVKVSDCTVDSLIVKGQSGFLRCGGIVGFFDGNATAAVSDCAVSNSTVEMSTGGSTYVGGIVGSSIQNVSDRDSGVIERCVSDGNTFDLAIKDYDTHVGGIIGSSSSVLQDCLSINNAFTLDESNSKSYVGGVAGFAQRNMERCIAYSDKFTDTHEYTSETFAPIGTFCGLVACVSNIMAVHCATHDIEFDNISKRDDLSLADSNSFMYCYSDSSTNRFTDEQWRDGTTVVSTLALDGDVWTAKVGEYPTLKKESI